MGHFVDRSINPGRDTKKRILLFAQKYKVFTTFRLKFADILFFLFYSEPLTFQGTIHNLRATYSFPAPRNLTYDKLIVEHFEYMLAA